jgi:hypothetical protein
MSRVTCVIPLSPLPCRRSSAHREPAGARRSRGTGGTGHACGDAGIHGGAEGEDPLAVAGHGGDVSCRIVDGDDANINHTGHLVRRRLAEHIAIPEVAMNQRRGGRCARQMQDGITQRVDVIACRRAHEPVELVVQDVEQLGPELPLVASFALARDRDRRQGTKRMGNPASWHAICRRSTISRVRSASFDNGRPGSRW